MVYKCSASGCKSGYDGRPKDASVTFHSFPLKNPDLLRKWMVAVRTKTFSPTKYSRLCSLHFQPDDFIHESSDTNVTRRRSMGSRRLILRRLKKDAYPTMKLPASSTSQEPTIKEEPQSPTPEQNSMIEIQFFDKSNSPKVSSDESSETTLSDINDFLDACPPPKGFYKISSQDQLVIYALSVNKGIPYVRCALTVTSDLTPIMSMGGSIIAKESFKNIVNGKINKITEIMNLLRQLETWLSTFPMPWTMTFIISRLLDIFKESCQLVLGHGEWRSCSKLFVCLLC